MTTETSARRAPRTRAAPKARTPQVQPWREDLEAVGDWLRTAPPAPILQLTARFGFLARAVFYLSVGALATLSLLRLAPRAGGATDAMAALSRWPAGLALIGLTACGLVGFSLWRAIQAVFDADGHGGGLRGRTVRAGQAVSGVAHAVLAWSLFGLLDGAEDLHDSDGGDAAQAMAARVLALPHGDVVLFAAGAIILAFGAGSVGQGLFQNFSKRLGCSERVRRCVLPLARAGYIGRGLSFAPVGFFLAKAGWDARASSAHDFAGALAAIDKQPGGHLVLLASAAGLIAFGLFAILEAAFRRIVMPWRHQDAKAAL